MPYSSTPRRLCIAPMMERTDRHFRFLLRLISRHVYLYTEMVPVQAMVHGDRQRWLRFDPAEHPVALQLGGDDPALLARCAAWAEAAGYDEVNLNVGCPSERVQAGRFGACLMLEPGRVSECVAAMSGAVRIPVTVKTRTGVDHHDGYDVLQDFVAQVAGAGCRTFIVHARKAWLNGLNPKENRRIPPLDYQRVVRLKRDFPGLEIILNGGINDLAAAGRFADLLDGVMIGRAAYDDPYLLSGVDRLFYGDPRPASARDDVVRAMLPYVAREAGHGTRLNAVSRHLLNLYRGCPGGRAWRRFLSEHAHRPGAGPAVLEQALAHRQAHALGRVA